MSAKIPHYDNNNCLNSPKSVVNIELVFVNLAGRPALEKLLVNSYLLIREVIFLDIKYDIFILSFRYVDANTRCSSLYRRYSEDLPNFVHDRPKTFVKHITDRLPSTREISKENVVKYGLINFSVRSSKTSRSYLLSFDDGNGNPMCECPD